ncbi:MAG: hypothetical protein Q8862_03485, partial [Bacteroidota bacterium]|nr:hypothetical protein [Bacteroidota bacterium]
KLNVIGEMEWNWGIETEIRVYKSNLSEKLILSNLQNCTECEETVALIIRVITRTPNQKNGQTTLPLPFLYPSFSLWVEQG